MFLRVIGDGFTLKRHQLIWLVEQLIVSGQVSTKKRLKEIPGSPYLAGYTWPPRYELLSAEELVCRELSAAGSSELDDDFGPDAIAMLLATPVRKDPGPGLSAGEPALDLAQGASLLPGRRRGHKQAP